MEIAVSLLIDDGNSRNIGRQASKPVRFTACAPTFVQISMSEPELEGGRAAFRRFDPVQMQLPWRRGGCSPEWGRGVKGGDAASFCQLQGYPRRTQRGTKESGDGDPREMTANLDRALPPAWTVNRADRVFNPFAARHHSFNLQCLNPNWKGAWQHFGALTQFRCSCPGGGGGCNPEWGRGVKGGDAASFCQLQGYPRRTQRGTKESGDGDPRGMIANLDRAPPPARTVNRADRVFSPLAARHHSFNLQCLNPVWKRSWQHCGALTQFRCNCPGENRVGCSPEWGVRREGGRCGFLLPASRISTKDTKGHEGKRRRRSQGDDRKSGPRTAAGADCEQGRSSLQPARCAPSFVQFSMSEPGLEEFMAAFRCFDPIQMQWPWREPGGVQPRMGGEA